MRPFVSLCIVDESLCVFYCLDVSLCYVTCVFVFWTTWCVLFILVFHIEKLWARLDVAF